MQFTEENNISMEVRNIKTAKVIRASLAADPGDFINRLIDSRTKKRPTTQDITNINEAIEELMKRSDVNNAQDPAQNPFVFLWLANRVT